ncbi:hypothetical protein AVEN_178348-1 [Araneus ventricosus]|uniref:Uncharacterized protein n=1 Tax=Araneus ventricosus TaxID=182803 RepID=A0A4Y2BC90_ARAVE|nr:hypothetical protein AVEN_178348-1 [Araneus ventricosus]
MRQQDPSKSREGETGKPETSTREDSMNTKFANKKNDISSREIVKDLKLNVSALTVCLIIKNSGFISCIQRKRAIHLKTKHGNGFVICKRAYFEGFKPLGQCFMAIQKQTRSFRIEKMQRVWGRSVEALKIMNIPQRVKH